MRGSNFSRQLVRLIADSASASSSRLLNGAPTRVTQRLSSPLSIAPRKESPSHPCVHCFQQRRSLYFTSSARAAAPSAEGETPDISQAAHIPAYPFATRVITRATPQVGEASRPHVLKRHSARRSILPLVQNDLKGQYDPTSRMTAFFARNSTERIPPGSVITVETWTSATTKNSFSSFSGVLLAIKRRGTATSFLVRNIVNKLGVEVRFSLYSPLLKDIKVVQRANGKKRNEPGKLRRARRAKLYYLRGDERKLTNITSVIKRQKAEVADATRGVIRKR
ncbi:hypothetical protein K437DRAFT_294467 [Tilletiaria anomala UBC 951]|uniref:Ribosomal protein L19 n=1 Tax=Tilletiaria anomala (strain ATCC 24038 / CBS 436.72 / UBC 951) TaxID=1037660 RepID=A0A066W069_TILAU|nr:uncharacterized protein K437DRAFT_294467 [Tilletiaria anomala UBC 951]KDN45923.1 hypothetical protein K437DRAFT_294467 [Tilletiaria anomala UBC 951]